MPRWQPLESGTTRGGSDRVRGPDNFPPGGAGRQPRAAPRRRSRWCMNTEFVVTCPYCGEEVEIYVEPDVRGSFVQDCEVCCNPWRLRVKGRGDERSVDVQRADGSE